MATFKPVDEHRGGAIFRIPVDSVDGTFRVSVEGIEKLRYFRFGTVTEAKLTIDNYLDHQSLPDEKQKAGLEKIAEGQAKQRADLEKREEDE